MKKYRKDMPKRLYSFFVTYHETNAFGGVLPSLSKFARHIGVTMADIERFRRHSAFDRAVCECERIRRDMLTDMALMRKVDPSFAKFLLSESSEGEAAEELKVTVTVVP